MREDLGGIRQNFKSFPSNARGDSPLGFVSSGSFVSASNPPSLHQCCFPQLPGLQKGALLERGSDLSQPAMSQTLRIVVIARWNFGAKQPLSFRSKLQKKVLIMFATRTNLTVEIKPFLEKAHKPQFPGLGQGFWAICHTVYCKNNELQMCTHPKRSS